MTIDHRTRDPVMFAHMRRKGLKFVRTIARKTSEMKCDSGLPPSPMADAPSVVRTFEVIDQMSAR